MKKKSNFAVVLAVLICLVFGISNEVMPDIFHSAGAGGSSSEGADIHFIDVGQGDAELVTCGDSAVLIDGGKRSAGDVVVDYLSRQGIAELDAVIATHPHEDHIGGLIDVFEAFTVKSVYISDEAMDTRTYENLLDAIEDEGIEPQFPDIGDTIPLGDSGAEFTVLAPGPDSKQKYGKDPNVWSIVVRLDAAGCSALFTGDTTSSVEKAMLADNLTLLNCDILKVAHHGSRTASCEQFIEAVSPKYAVMSYEEGNSYGLPDEEVFTYLEPLGTTIFETAKDGTVVLHMENGEVTEAA